jgi:ABC-type multidrug transport system ATPase subunit
LLYFVYRFVRDTRREARDALRKHQRHVKPLGHDAATNDTSNISSSAHDEKSALMSAFVDQAALRRTWTLDVEFTDLTCVLPNGKVILDHATGRFAPGRCTAIMGPSGAGKTTLLNALLGKIPISTGTVLINSTSQSLRRFQLSVGFVPQHDILIPCLTVKETLLHAARTRLPRGTSAAQMEERVNEVLHILGLYHVRHSIVGDPLRRGISGGERKRVSIGQELVADPALLILDEPTTGLDATVAQEVVQCLKSIALTGATVVTVLHQPRFEIFEMLDEILLLAKGGKTIYFGPASDTLAYFDRMGHPIPDKTNPSDFFLDILANPKLCATLKPLVAKSSVSTSVMHAPTDTDDGAHRSPAPFWTQFLAFFRRACIQYYRDLKTISIGVIMHFLSGISLGAVFSSSRGVALYLPQISEQEAQRCPYIVRDRCLNEPLQQDVLGNVVFFVLMILSGCSIVSSLLTFGEEKLVFKREAAGGVSRLAYFMAKCVVDLPFLTFNTLLFTSLFYFFLYPHGTFRHYVIFCFLIVYASYGCGYLVSICTRKQNATVTGVVVSVVLSVCAGTHPALKQVKRTPPLYWLWCLSFQRWIGELFYIYEVGSYSPEYEVKGGFDMTGFNPDNESLDIGMAVLLGTLCRVGAFVILWWKHRKNNL